MDALGILLTGVREPLETIKGYLDGVGGVKESLRQRYNEYLSVVESLQAEPDMARNVEHELRRLIELFGRVAMLIGHYTASPGDQGWRKAAVKIDRAIHHESVTKDLEQIDVEVRRQLAIISAKGVLRSEVPEAVGAIGTRVDSLIASIASLKTRPSLLDKAPIPPAAGSLPDKYIERRATMMEVVEGLTDPGLRRAPCVVLVGMGGGGKTVLASSIVRDDRVRRHYRRGIFWLKVGRCKKSQLHGLLLPLAREVAAGPADPPVPSPPSLDSLDAVTGYLSAVAAAGDALPRLVVLDDVWERYAVDALRGTGFRLLITTRDGTIAGHRSCCVEVGDMSEGEALALLIKASEGVRGATGCAPEEDVRTAMLQVAEDCGRLPLALAIAGSMPAVKGGMFSARAWDELHARLRRNKAKMQRMKGEEGSSVRAVLDLSLDALSDGQQERFLSLAVLPHRVTAPADMLAHLWEIEDVDDTADEAEVLVSRSLLHAVDGGYCVHDMVLDYASVTVDRDDLEAAVSRQARYLSAMETLRAFAKEAKHTNGLHGLIMLWRSVEKLAGDPEIQGRSYSEMLRGMETGARESNPMARVVWAARTIARLFELQEGILDLTVGQVLGGHGVEPRLMEIFKLFLAGRFDEAMRLQLRVRAEQEGAPGLDPLELAQTLDSISVLQRKQGRHEESEQTNAQALKIREKHLGPKHGLVAQSVSNGTVNLSVEGKHAEAEAKYRLALAMVEEECGPDDLKLVQYLNNLAGSLCAQGKEAEGMECYYRSLAIRRKALGTDHVSVATALYNIARSLRDQGHHDEALMRFEESRVIRAKVLGPDDPSVASSLKHMAETRKLQGRYDEAVRLSERSLAILEGHYGCKDLKVVQARRRLEALRKIINKNKFRRSHQGTKATLDLWVLSPGFILCCSSGLRTVVDWGHSRTTHGQRDLVLMPDGLDVPPLVIFASLPEVTGKLDMAWRRSPSPRWRRRHKGVNIIRRR